MEKTTGVSEGKNKKTPETNLMIWSSRALPGPSAPVRRRGLAKS